MSFCDEPSFIGGHTSAHDRAERAKLRWQEIQSMQKDLKRVHWDSIQTGSVRTPSDDAGHEGSDSMADAQDSFCSDEGSPA